MDKSINLIYNLDSLIIPRRKEGIQVISAFTGIGKTEAMIDLLANYRFTDRDAGNKGIIYAAKTLEEVLEVVLRLRDKLINFGYSKSNANRYIKNNIGLLFNLLNVDSTTKNIFTSLNFSIWDKKFLEGLICNTKVTCNLFKKNIIITTHETLANKCDIFDNYHVYIDEVPNYSFVIENSRGEASEELTSLHKKLANLAYRQTIQPSATGLKIASGMLKITDVIDEGSNSIKYNVYHLNSQHNFASFTILTANAECTHLIDIKKLGENINFTIYKENADKIREDLKLIKVEVLGNKHIYNKDTGKIMINIKKGVDEKRALMIATNKQGNDLNIKTIRSNQTGINCLANKDIVLVATQLNLDCNQQKFMSILWGEQAENREKELAGAKILQSIYRSAIRQGKEIRVVFGSEEAYERVKIALLKN